MLLDCMEHRAVILRPLSLLQMTTQTSHSTKSAATTAHRLLTKQMCSCHCALGVNDSYVDVVALNDIKSVTDDVIAPLHTQDEHVHKRHLSEA